MNIGKAMKEIREDRGLSRQELAKEIGCTSTALWKVENGKTKPKWDTVLKFCRSMEVSIARLYTMSFEAIDFCPPQFI